MFITSKKKWRLGWNSSTRLYIKIVYRSQRQDIQFTPHKYRPPRAVLWSVQSVPLWRLPQQNPLKCFDILFNLLVIFRIFLTFCDRLKYARLSCNELVYCRKSLTDHAPTVDELIVELSAEDLVKIRRGVQHVPSANLSTFPCFLQ